VAEPAILIKGDRTNMIIFFSVKNIHKYMFKELFRKSYTISYQNNHILTKKIGKINIFCTININTI